MRVKRYIVDSMPEALDKIRADLGKDAVILNSKPVKTGGMFGMFGKMRIEVIAAVDEKASENEKTQGSSMSRQMDATTRPQAGTYTAKQAYRNAAVPQPMKTESAVAVQEREPSPDVVSLEPKRDFTTREAAPANAVNERPKQPEPPIQTSRQVENQTGTTGTDELASEVRGMRQMFQKLLVHDLSQQLPEAFQVIRTRLLDQGVTEEVTAEILKKLMEKTDAAHQWQVEEARDACREIITGMLAANAQTSVRLERSVQYAFFFGPTGVGKTTTIAKMAANSMLKEKRRIGFITADTYRMAAVEQLKTYANILNVPMEVVFQPKEMVTAMERLSDCDLIFVDTAGRNFRNDEYVQGIRELVEQGTNSVNYLVLSLTSKYTDMKAIIQNFSDVPVKQVIFTKADETQSFGTMLNVSEEMKLALSYITTGQNVPDDIVVATPTLVSSMVVGD
ncbi:flagellar biosynthesis protein FlhF [Brevibacillus choshinensis]|uniref:flagellar biosynthesis protein FlhF n=1 Tax=Brevibacillus choshinensis TaxID=54911 RepID=UPI002E1B0A6E|nr:flagellar biosynthesis protein FlhF [Brevibacillus choshinensis]MED4750140.1 flagellar biosynthesis protein FlhF [Brevibacillus choshinensis]